MKNWRIKMKYKQWDKMTIEEQRAKVIEEYEEFVNENKQHAFIMEAIDLETACKGMVYVACKELGYSEENMRSKHYKKDADRGYIVDDTPTNYDNKTIWKVGQKVWDVLLGDGVVSDITTSTFPILVNFEIARKALSYNTDGYNNMAGENRRLYPQKMILVADMVDEKPAKTPVNYYDVGGVKSIEMLDKFLDICKDIMGEEITPRDCYSLGNIFKYIRRAGIKTPDPSSDLFKAADYVKKFITGSFYEKK